MARAQFVIENPILNRPFDAPERHFRFDDDGITDEVVAGRRPSSYFMPIPKAKKKGGQLVFDEWTGDRIKETKLINQIRERVGRWRDMGWPGVTPTTRSLLEYWTDPEREKKLFFCQVEALETAIYITECAKKQGDPWIENELRESADDANPGLFRMAHKMATGTGKTVVMAMLIAWHTLNKVAAPKDGRFGDAFLLVAPGITIRDRLRVLLPSDPDSYYRQRDIVPADRVSELGRAKIVITNFHAFQLREKIKAPKLAKELAGQRPGVFTEAPEEMVRRVTRELGTKKNIIVLNDEAHHCYRRRVGGGDDDELDVALTGEDKRDAAKRDEEARVWITGLQAIAAKTGIRAVYDLSATPFYLRGSGWPEGTLFQWVVSDFSLIDAIEAGLVKIPRVPVDDNAAPDDLPTYRGLWMKIRDDLPKKGRKTDAVDGKEPILPGPLEGALQSLYGNYEKSFRDWEARSRDENGTGTGSPPVFIVVCNNTNVSKLVFDYIAGWEKTLPGGGTVVVPGQLDLFSNEQAGAWSSRPTTILVDSTQLDSGETMTADFKAAAAAEIEEFKSELRQRFPGRDVDELTDEDLLREVMNTVGKPGKLGENVRCVVSVSMLTEGWDANTVTHVLGVRAFGTQLLCEQVVGRGLRRRSYVVDDDGRFTPEYAEVYGIPFSFIPASGGGVDPPPGPIPSRVRAVEDRIACEITFPRVVGYRWEIPEGLIDAAFDDDSKLALSTRDVPTRTDVAAVVGEVEEHRLDRFEHMRPQEVAFLLTKRLLERYFHAPDEDGQPGAERPWLFPKLAEITKRWISECVTLKDDAFVGLLAMAQRADDAVEKINGSINRYAPGEHKLVPLLRPFEPIGSTCYVDFDTTKDTFATKADTCHVTHVACDSGWEAHLAGKLEHQRVSTDCPYCGEPLADSSPEHVFPRSIGGREFVIGVHGRCNRRANSLIDSRLLGCARVRAARASAQLRSHRTGEPYEERLVGETVHMVRLRPGRAYDIRDVDSLTDAIRMGDEYGGRGAKVQISRQGERLAATFVPNPIRDADGVLNTFGGQVEDGSAEPGFEPFTVLAVVEIRRRCSHPDDTWPRFTAKVGLGLAHLLRHSTAELEDGFRTADTLSSDGYEALVSELRRIAFDTDRDAVRGCEPDWISTVDTGESLHTVGLLKRDADAEIVVQLFGELRYHLAVPGVDVRHPVQLSVGRHR